jgi:hypothetical protein
MKVAILGSRDQLCVNPAVMQAPSSREKLNMCQEFVKMPRFTRADKVSQVKRTRFFISVADPDPYDPYVCGPSRIGIQIR